VTIRNVQKIDFLTQRRLPQLSAGSKRRRRAVENVRATSIAGFGIALLMLAASIASARISSPALAQGFAPPLRVQMLPSLIPDAIAQMLPMTFDSPANETAIERQRITLIAMVYCGGDSAGGAYAIGIAVPGQAQALPTSALSIADCGASLANTAARLRSSSRNSDWLEAIKLRAAWTPWLLTLSIAGAAGVARHGYIAPNLNNLGQIKSLNTAGLRILTGPGAHIAFDLAASFPGLSITLIAFPSGTVSDPLPYLNDPAVGNEITSAPATSNVIADAQYTFINQVLRLYGSTFDIPFPIEGGNDTMTAKNVTVKGAENAMTVAGILEYRAVEYDASVRCIGRDLAVNEVMLDAPAANCNQDDVIERLQCQGQGIATSSSSKGLAAAITNYYQGQPLRISTQAHPLDFTIDDNNFQATFDALKSSSHGGSFSEAGHASIQRGGGS
jgi:hypothetical protein